MATLCCLVVCFLFQNFFESKPGSTYGSSVKGMTKPVSISFTCQKVGSTDDVDDDGCLLSRPFPPWTPSCSSIIIILVVFTCRFPTSSLRSCSLLRQGRARRNQERAPSSFSLFFFLPKFKTDQIHKMDPRNTLTQAQPVLL